jgi:hypothetical protein
MKKLFLCLLFACVIIGCRSAEFAQVIEAIGGEDQTVCSVTPERLVVCAAAIDWARKYEEIYGADLAAAAVEELQGELDLFEDRPVGEIGAWAICPTGPAWMGLRTEIAFTDEIEEGFVIPDEEVSGAFVSECDSEISGYLNGVAGEFGGSYSAMVDAFVEDMDEAVLTCVDSLQTTVANDFVSFGGGLAGELFKHGGQNFWSSAGRSAWGVGSGAAVSAVATYFYAVGRFFAGAESRKQGYTDFWDGSVDPTKAAEDSDYAEGFNRAKGTCLAIKDQGGELPESCKKGLRALCAQGDEQACAAIETETEDAASDGEDVSGGATGGSSDDDPGSTDNPDGAPGDSVDSREPGGMSGCEQLEHNWNRMKQFCESTGWNALECRALIYSSTLCADPRLVYPDPVHGNQCIVAMSNEELAAALEEEACALRGQVAVLTHVGEQMHVDCESYSAPSSEDARRHAMRARCRFMLTDGGICDSWQDEITLPGNRPDGPIDIDPGAVDPGSPEPKPPVD